MTRPIVDRAGVRYGRLVALRPLPKPTGKHVPWLCVCDCGAEAVVVSCRLGKSTNSCGCLARELASERMRALGPKTVHGLSGSVEQTTRTNIISRCYNPRNKSFRDYGDRGVSVCDRWRFGQNGQSGLECFVEDMGRRPSRKHSIDRIDPRRGYDPDNCRWVHVSHQNLNKRNTKMVSVDGATIPLATAVKGAPVGYKTALERIQRGWGHKEAIWTPPKKVWWGHKAHPKPR